MSIRELISKPFGLKSSIAVNIAANIVTAAVFIISVPLVVPYIGYEAYGLVGIFVAIQGIVIVLDLGLNVAITREFATKADRSTEIWNLLRTAEVIYWAITALAIVLWAAFAGSIGRSVNPQGLSSDTVYHSFLLMGISLALQFPVSLYGAGLFGLQRQALVSGITTFFAVVRYLGVVAALRYFSASVETYFIWTAVVVAVQIPILAIALRSAMPKSSAQPRFDLSLLTGKWKFVLGIGLSTLASTLLFQTDKFVVARMFSLETFGFYALAATVAGGLQWLVQPVFRGTFPRLSQVAETGDQSRLAELYHQSCQLMAIAVLPVSTICVFFAWELMLLWQRDPAAADNSSTTLRFLIAGGAINALIVGPFALQLAFGSTRLQVFTLLAALAAAVPMAIVFSGYWGPAGAAAAWLVVNVALLSLVAPLTHRQFLSGETSRWAIRDVLLPVLAAAAGAASMRLAYRETDSYLLMTVQIGLALAFVTVCCIASADVARDWMRQRANAFSGRRL
jgi:O-antigen/teichoic acid export membrane protein